MIYLALVIVIVWGVFAWRHWSLAVTLLAGLLPTYLLRFKIGWLPMTILEELILLTTAIWLIKQYPQPWINLKTKAKNWRVYPLTAEMIIVLLVAWLSLLVTNQTTSALGLWKAYFIEPILVFILFWQIPDKTKKIHLGYLFLAISLLMIGLIAGYQYLTGHLIANPFWANLATRRATSVFGYPNAIGLFAGPISLALLGYLIYRIKSIKPKWSWFNLTIFLSIIVGWLSIYWASSKGAAIGLVIALIILGLIANHWSRLATVAFLAIISLTTSQVPNYQAQFKQRLFLKDLSGQIRQSQWQETWQMLADGRWFLGAGLGDYQTVIKPYHQEGIWLKLPTNRHQLVWQPLEIYLYPHNIFLNFWSELGLLGLLIFIWLWFKAIIINLLNFWQGKNNHPLAWLSWGLLGAWLASLVHGLVDVPYFKNDLAVLFWLGLAITMWVKDKLAKSKHEQPATN